MNYVQFQKLITRLVEMHGEDPSPILVLESQFREHPASRRSLVAFDPLRVIRARDDRIELVQQRGTEHWRENPWQALQRLRTQHPGWYFGYLGYDLKNAVEDLHSGNPDAVEAPDMLFFQPKEVLILDHQSGTVSFPAGESPRLRRLVEQYESDGDRPTGIAGEENSGDRGKVEERETAGASAEQEIIGLEKFASITTGERYLEQIRRAMELIREGEFYEVNLSHLLQGDFTGSSWQLYSKMKDQGPVPFGAYMKWGEMAICSASPERFLCRDGQRLFSQPIKGTAPRMIDPEQDRKVREKLLNSEKERAENLMIVDLVRHDLSKVAVPGSIRVPELFSLHRFETVHQLISTVEGRVDPNRDPVEILRACFPMGSMTGAPKIRAMQAIEELEEYRRGIYSGAIGYLDPEGNFDFNVVIRTAVLRGDRLYYAVGGAITSDSDPQLELEETWVKARALTHALHSQ